MTKSNSGVFSAIQIFCKLGLIMIGSIIAATLLMVLVYSLPTDRMFDHVNESKEIYAESYSDLLLPDIPSSALSKPTEAIMLNNAIYDEEDDSLVNKALLNPRYDTGEGNVQHSLMAVLDNGNTDTIHTVSHQMTPKDSFMPQDTETEGWVAMYYPRYWHGYLLFLKPLLLFLNVAEIKLLNMVVQFLLLGIALLLVYKRVDKWLPFALLTTLLILNPVTLMMSFQEADMFYIMILAIIVISAFDQKLSEKNRYLILFLMIGIATAFVDFLTYPLVGLGIPLALVIILHKDMPLLAHIKKIICFSVTWAAGYMTMWAGKLVVCSMLTGYNALLYGVESVVLRINGSTEDLPAIDFKVMMADLFHCVVNWPNVLIAIVLVVAVCLLISRGYKRHISLIQILTLLIIASYPFFWFVATQNHSAIHPYMAFRELAITWFCLSSILLYGWEKQANQKDSEDSCFCTDAGVNLPDHTDTQRDNK